MKKYKRLVVYFLIGMVVQLAFLLILPIVYRYLFDHVIPEKQIHNLIVITILLTLGALSKVAMDLLSEYSIASIGINITRDLRMRLLLALNCRRIDYLKNIEPGQILSHFSNDLTDIENIIIFQLGYILKYLLLSFFSVFVLFYFSPLLGFISLISLPIPVIIFKLSSKRALELNMNKREHESYILGLFQEIISTQTSIRAYNLQSFWISIANKSLKKWLKVGVKAEFANIISGRGITLSTRVLEICIILIASLLAIKGSLTLGTIFGFILFYQYMLMGVDIITESLPMTYSAMTAIKRINNFLENDNFKVIEHGAVRLQDLKSEIIFNDVSYTYESGHRAALNKVNICVPKGSFIAFVGESGGGKSTILSLLLKFYQVTSGEILFDGNNINDISSRSLRDNIRIVFQDNNVFHLSIYDNIRMGYLNAKYDDIINAAKHAEIHDYITSLPDGYDTMVGDSKGILSGGQRQRLALARALVANPSILLLDEITSSLDLATEAEINKTLSRIMKDQTVIMVTHRLYTVVSADNIYVFKNGDIIESGRHEELIAKKGYYSELWKNT
ncbi:MAG: ABC transporter ATP-binding protein [Legionellaceae bacterium]|nr:ABC transporter ATP-binding protein [Legionellaceae bacterium]